MMWSFCAGTNLKAYLYREDCAPILKIGLSILDPVLQKQEIQNGSHEGNVSHANGKQSLLSSEAHTALTLANQHLCKLQWDLLAEESRTVEKLVINGFRFMSYRQLVCDSAIFFQPLNSHILVPGFIDLIRVCEEGEDWLVVWQLLPVPTSLVIANPSMDTQNSGPKFGLTIRLWALKLSQSPNQCTTVSVSLGQREHWLWSAWIK